MSNNGTSGTTARARAKAERRGEILRACARLMARRGFHAVRLDDIAAEVGLTGPAMYRYFASKEEVLAALLLDISTRLRDGGRAAESAPEAITALVGVHVDFVVAEPDLISIQFRDLDALPDAARRAVQTMQREYVEIWVTALSRQRPELDAGAVRAHVHAVFGLLNSSPRLPSLPPEQTRNLLTRMALAALTA